MGKRISAIVLAGLFIFTLPGIARGDEPDPVVTQVIWDRTGAENLPCPDGAHWRFDQGGTEILNVSIHLDEVSGWGMDFDIADGYPRLFTVDTMFPLTASTAVDYTYIGVGDAADHLVLESCLPPPPPVLKTFHIEVTVSTPIPKLVRVFWGTTCEAGGVSTKLRGNYKTMTPDTREIPVPLSLAEDCRAWATAKSLVRPRVTPTVQVLVDAA